MNFSSKLTIAIATAAALCPIAANANPVVSTGSTAATVSIKFQSCKKCGPTSGDFSITPGTKSTGGGNGVQELSAAVATGETRADATSTSNFAGTTATATGFSQPVTFSYSNTSDVSNRTITSELATTTKTQKDTESKSANSQDGFTKTANANSSESANNAAAQQAAANQSANSQDGTGKSASARSSESASATQNAAAAEAKAKGKLGTSINLGGVASLGAGSSEANIAASASGSNSAKASESASNNVTQKNTASQSANSNSSSSSGANAKAAETASLDTAQKNAASQSASSKDGANNTLNSKNGDTSNTSKTNLNYQYTGSSVGLSFIPMGK